MNYENKIISKFGKMSYVQVDDCKKRKKGLYIHYFVTKIIKSRFSSLQDATTPEVNVQAESAAPQEKEKKKKRPKQATQSPTKTQRRRKKSATDNNSSAPVKKRKSKQVSSTDGISDPDSSLSVSVPGRFEN